MIFADLEKSKLIETFAKPKKNLTKLKNLNKLTHKKTKD